MTLDAEAAVRQTAALMAEFAKGRPRVPLFEAAFAADGVVVLVDVLEPLADGRWCLLEVKSGIRKSGVEVPERYVADAAVQAWVLERCRVPLARVEIGQPDSAFVLPVWHLGSEPTTRVVADLMRDGFRDLAEVPPELLKPGMHRVMREIARGAGPYVDEGLREHLRGEPFPRYFLDFEFASPPLPAWRGTRPGERVPFQFSLHKWTAEDAPLEHVEFLAEGLRQGLLDYCGTDTAVMVQIWREVSGRVL